GVGASLLAAALPEALRERRVRVPRWLQDAIADPADQDERGVRLPAVAALAVATAGAAAYLYPGADLHGTFMVSNALAWCIGMQAIGLITIQSFLTACVFLGGLFLYDIYWVFGTDVMLTVATRFEAPVKFIFPLPADVERAYPFAVLGLGDIVIPAIVISLLRNLDKSLAERDAGRAGTKVSYFHAGVAAYAMGLAACFVANTLSKSGQPALLYLNPAVIGSALIVAAVNGGEFRELFDFTQESTLPQPVAVRPMATKQKKEQPK
ncbi:signal peptide peptidase-domain-containing protein, partial [Tribonema minus]